MTDEPGGQWIATDEADDVAGSIRHAIAALDMVGDDPLAWKWVALALHLALQGACVCHLTITASPVGALTKKSTEKWWAYLNAPPGSDLPRPKTVLMALPDLLKAARRPNSAGDRSNIAGIAISDGELVWLRRFHDNVRNQFVHFEPKGWSLEVSGIPELGTLIARIIGDIAAYGWAFRHQGARWRRELRDNLDALSAEGPQE